MTSNPIEKFLIACEVRDFKVEDDIKNWCIHYHEYPKKMTDEEKLRWINYDDYGG